MFYGDFGEGRREAFKDCLTLLGKAFGRVYANDNLIALQRTAGFLQDKRFRQAVIGNVDRTNSARASQERSLAWRLHTLTWAARHCLSVDGDYVEAGVYRGFSFGVIAEYLDWATIAREMYLYDTFEGIPETYNSEGRNNRVYEEENSLNKDQIYNTVLARFSKYENVKIVRGIVPDSFRTSCPERIAFMHIDMNSAKSEIATLDALWGKVVPGAIVVFDDYGWSGYAAQKAAEDKWMAANGHTILELPTGQGMVIKKA